ncbi:hypothetical protein GQ457_09G019360 [Hibiscus cannabinus]
MVETALKFKKDFDNLYTKGGAYCKDLRRHFGVPDDDDWRRVEAFLQIFYDTTLKVSGSLHVTSNSYVLRIFGVRDLISSCCCYGSESIREMAHQMKVKHDKYWGHVDNLNILMFVALLLDPRHKWGFEWWSGSQMRYPILAQMARDMLAIPISTVASKSAFSTGVRVLDSFRTSLTPRIAEALICSQDLLRQSQGSLIIEENLLELEELEDG